MRIILLFLQSVILPNLINVTFMINDSCQIKVFLSHYEIIYLFGLLDEKFVELDKMIRSTYPSFPDDTLDQYEFVTKLYGKFNMLTEL